MLRRRHHPEEKASGKAEGRQKAHAPVRHRPGSQRSVYRCAEDGLLTAYSAGFGFPPEECLCFSGHRFISAADREKLVPLLDAVLAEAYAEGKRVFLSGGAVGFDTLAAQAVLRLREREKDARLVMALPCRGQADRWQDPDRKTWLALLESADRVVYVSADYFPGCMQKRNRFLADHAAECCCFMRTCRGGTWNTVSYAYDRGLKIRNLALELR